MEGKTKPPPARCRDRLCGDTGPTAVHLLHGGIILGHVQTEEEMREASVESAAGERRAQEGIISLIIKLNIVQIRIGFSRSTSFTRDMKAIGRSLSSKR